MEKRFFLALLLTAVVVVVTPSLFPRTIAPAVAPDSAGAPNARAVANDAPAVLTPGRVSPPAPTPTSSDTTRRLRGDTVLVRTTRSVTAFNSLGAAPHTVQLDSFAAFNGSSKRVSLVHGVDPLLSYRIITPTDTIAIERTVFSHAVDSSVASRRVLTFSGASAHGEVRITYQIPTDDYLSTVTVHASGLASPAFLLVDLPTGFDTQEADSTGDFRLLAYSVKPVNRGARGTAFSSLDAGESKLEPGPLAWAIAKSKYFLVGILAPTGGTPFADARITGGTRTRKVATNGAATVVVPMSAGDAKFELYAGPQSWERLHQLGREFETANPYGGWLQPIVQPFSTIVMRILLWMKKAVRLDYGWVLVIFGVAVRLLMWPLNQSAMRTSLRMQRIQPELMGVQKKHKSDPQKAQQEMMRVYKEHGMSPFSAFSGCLPMLIPMPVLMALFFVFQNTIEFRGVSFLWLRDISLHDPLYILPLLMGVTMFLLSWIGMRNMPPNPQSKMISYLLPVMLTVVLLQSAAGLSLYYAVQNIAALPQQWLIANERARAKPA
jgi:YidC/Oxa1 family membrane protein insertase